MSQPPGPVAPMPWLVERVLRPRRTEVGIPLYSSAEHELVWALVGAQQAHRFCRRSSGRLWRWGEGVHVGCRIVVVKIYWPVARVLRLTALSKSLVDSTCLEEFHICLSWRVLCSDADVPRDMHAAPPPPPLITSLYIIRMSRAQFSLKPFVGGQRLCRLGDSSPVLFRTVLAAAMSGNTDDSAAAKKGGGGRRTSGATPNLNIDLEILDADFDDIFGPDAEQSATAVKAEVKEEKVKSEAAPTKRRRLGTGRFEAGSSSQSLHGVAEVSLEGNEDEADSAEEAGDADGKACIGCDRIYGVSPSIIHPGETIQWANPGGRGCWCKDCRAVYRTVFAGRGWLGDLESWLKVDATKRAEFHLSRVAYLSLVFEGNLGNIHKEHVQARLHMLKWMSHVCCLHLEPHVVVPFEEAAAGDSPWRRFAALPSHLTTIQSMGEHRLCVCAHTDDSWWPWGDGSPDPSGRVAIHYSDVSVDDHQSG